MDLDLYKVKTKFMTKNSTIRKRKVVGEVAWLWSVYDRRRRLGAKVWFAPFTRKSAYGQENEQKELK
jgi:hypothetical protein